MLEMSNLAQYIKYLPKVEADKHSDSSVNSQGLLGKIGNPFGLSSFFKSNSVSNHQENAIAKGSLEAVPFFLQKMLSSRAQALAEGKRLARLCHTCHCELVSTNKQHDKKDV